MHKPLVLRLIGETMTHGGQTSTKFHQSQSQGYKQCKLVQRGNGECWGLQVLVWPFLQEFCWPGRWIALGQEFETSLTKSQTCLYKKHKKLKFLAVLSTTQEAKCLSLQDNNNVRLLHQQSKGLNESVRRNKVSHSLIARMFRVQGTIQLFQGAAVPVVQPQI